MLTIVAPEKHSKHPLSFQRLGELPLPAYIELDLKNRVVSFTHWERNTRPTYVTLGHARWWRIDHRTNRRAAIKLAKELDPLFERLCDGYVSDWDGRNHIGVLDADAQAALEEVASLLSARLESV